MQLPYSTPPLPSWMSNSHPCVVPRPLLTAERAYAQLIPRLFPFELNAKLVASPKNQKPYSIVQTQLQCYRQSNTCVLVDNNPKLLSMSTSGRLSDIYLWNPSFTSEGAIKTLCPIPRSRRPCQLNNSSLQQIPWNDSVIALSAVTSDEPFGVLTAQVENGVCVALFDSDGSNLSWTDMVQVPACFAYDFNSLSRTELVTLDKFSLRCFDLYQSSPVQTLESDLQPLTAESCYRWLHYGAHPRTVLLANRNRIARIDLRSPDYNPTSNVLVDMRLEWKLTQDDPGTSFFVPHPTHPFRCVVATGSLTAILDSRMITKPMLEWNTSWCNQSLIGAVSTIRNTPDSDLIIALSAATLADFSVLHACQNIAAKIEGGGMSLPYQPHLIWSDMPLMHLDRFVPGIESRGLALVPRPNGEGTNVVQCSAAYGVISQLVACSAFRDESVQFEPATLRPDHKRTSFLVGLDTASNFRDNRDALIFSNSNSTGLKDGHRTIVRRPLRRSRDALGELDKRNVT